MQFRTQIISGYAVILFFLLLVTAVIYKNTSLLTSSNAWVLHTQKVIAQGIELEKLLADMETGERGFLITGHEEFLEPYNNAIARFDQEITHTKELVDDNSKQLLHLGHIQQLANRWKEEAAQPEIETRRKVAVGAKDAAYLQEILSRGVGKGIMDELRGIFDKLLTNAKAKGDEKGQILLLSTIKVLIDQETGERGFIITGKEHFLDPYFSGIQDYEKHLIELKQHLAGDTEGLALLHRIDRLEEDWKRLAANPEIAARTEMNRSTTSMEDVITLVKKRTGKAIMDTLRKELHEFIKTERELIKVRRKTSEDAAAQTKNITIFSALAALILGLLIALHSIRSVMRAVGGEPANIAAMAKRVSKGDFGILRERQSRAARGILASLLQMVEAWKEKSDEVEAQLWLKTESTRITGLFQRTHNQQALIETVITELATSIKAGHGAVYLLQKNDNKGHRSRFALMGSYACQEHGHVTKQFRLGEGLMGQCALEKKTILLTQAPADYIQISSGLGKQTPHNILIQPIVDKNKVWGVLELASFHEFTPLQQELLRHVTDDLGLVITALMSHQRTEELLEASQLQAEELQSQQEELKAANEELEDHAKKLRCSEEELQQQGEELRVINEELQEKTQYLERQKREIENKNSTIEEANKALEIKAEELTLTSRYKSEFLANMSHELRTPLNSLLILAKTLAGNEDGNLTNDQTESACIIHSSGIELLELINGILDLAKVEAGKMDVHIDEITIEELISNIYTQFNPLAKEKRLEFKVEITQESPVTLKTDIQKIRQILKNLLSNAFKFTHQGSITLQVHPAAMETRFHKNNLKPATTLAFSVIDTGIGIPEDKQDLIFGAFQQADGSTSRSYGGTGLGLNISRELAQLLGGEIKLQSQTDKGATFTLYLPIAGYEDPLEKEPASVGEPVMPSPFLQINIDPAASGPGGKELSAREYLPDDRREIAKEDKSLLVVEDDTRFARILMEIAKESGYKCLVAEDGQGGIELACRYRPSAIILDLGLPDISGLRVLDILKDNPVTRDIPVHVMSARDDDGMARQKGAIDYLAKPISTEAIRKAIKTFEANKAGTPKRILVMQKDSQLSEDIRKLVKEGEVDTSITASIQDLNKELLTHAYDGIFMDFTELNEEQHKLLEALCKDPSLNLPPVIVLLNAEPATDAVQLLERCAQSVIIRGEKSEERLRDEVALFLHKAESGLPKEQQAARPMKYSADHTLKGRKILLVDDDLRNTFALSKILHKHGLEVVLADNGKMALEKLDKEKGIELVIMDIMMPVMDGYEATRKIRQLKGFEQLPILAVTAKAMPEDRAKCIKAGASDYLGKPIDIDRLLSMMRVWLYK